MPTEQKSDNLFALGTTNKPKRRLWINLLSSFFIWIHFVKGRFKNTKRAFSQHSQSRNKKSAAREANSDALRTLLHNDENVPTSSFCAFLHLGRSSSYFFHLPGQQPHLRNEWRRRHRKLVQYTIYFYKFNIRTNFVPFFFTHF